MVSAGVSRAPSRPGPRSPTPASAGATCSSRSAAATPAATPTRSSPTSGSPGIEFVNVSNGCATGGSALAMADRAIRSGAYDLGIAIGFDKHPPGAFNADPAAVRARRLVRRDRHDAHDAVLRDEDPALPARARHRPGGARHDRGQGVPQRRAEPERMAAHADVEEEIAESPMVRPARRSTCSARRPRAPSRSCCAGPTSPTATPTARVLLRSCVMRTRRYGTFEVFSPSLAPERADGPTVQAAARRVRAGRHRSRRCRRRPDPGHRVGRRDDAHGRDRVCARTASRRS